MPANKFDFVTHFRSKKKEAAEKERQERLDLENRAPQIIDPSFELFGHKSAQEQYEHGAYNYGSNKVPSSNDDWMFHNRRASTISHSYQFEPFCEVTPKSSVSSSNSNNSDRIYTDSDMMWGSSSTSRPRPQSYLPPMPSAYSYSTTDLQRSSAYESRRYSSMDQGSMCHDRLPTHEPSMTVLTSSQSIQTSQPYKLEASLSRPFSLSEPYDAFDVPEDSEQTQQDHTTQRLTPIQEDGSVSEHRDHLVKRG